MLSSYRFAKVLFASAAFFAAAASPSFAQKRYTVQNRWVIGGEGSWDYLTVDAAAHRLYIAHETKVDVVDLNTGKVIGSIPGLARCHGIVISPDHKAGFISDGNQNNVAVFDPNTFTITSRIPTGAKPDGMTYEPATNTIWVFDKDSKQATVIDPAQRKAVATVALPGHPEFPVADGQGAVFVNIEDSHSVVKLDARTHKVAANWVLPGCESPSGITMDRQGGRIFSVCDGNKMSVTDARSGKALGSARIGDGPDAAGYDAQRKLVFVPAEDGTLTVVDAAKPGFPVVETLPTMKGARTLAFDQDSGKLYTVSAQPGKMPAPNPALRHTRPTPVPGTFKVLVIGPA